MPTDLQMQILLDRHPGIGDAVLRANAAALLEAQKSYPLQFGGNRQIVSTLAALPLPEARKRKGNGTGGDVVAKFAVRESTDEVKLNKTERAYLAHLRSLGHPWVGVQNLTLKLADDCRLTPDFSYIPEGGRFVFVDVKGFQREDALLKMKFAARLFRWADFVIVKKAKDGWDERPVKP